MSQLPALDWEKVLWKVTWVNLQMMLADMPRVDYTKKNDKNLPDKFNSESDLIEFMRQAENKRLKK